MSAVDEARLRSMRERVDSMLTADEQEEIVDLVGMSDLQDPSFWRAVLAEFVGMFFFIFISVGAVIYGVMGSLNGNTGGPSVFSIAAGFGFAIFVTVGAVAGISGGHLNPAVSWALVTIRKCSLVRAGLYTVAQILGAMLAAGFIRWGGVDALKHIEGVEELVPSYVKGEDRYNAYIAAGGGLNAVTEQYMWAGVFGEFVMTGFLLFVVASVTDKRAASGNVHLPTVGPLMIGMAVMLAHLVLVPITGCSINPARSMGTMIIGSDIKIKIDNNGKLGSSWGPVWWVWGAPLLGGIAGVQIYYWSFHQTRLATAAAAGSSQNPLTVSGAAGDDDEKL